MPIEGMTHCNYNSDANYISEEFIVLKMG